MGVAWEGDVFTLPGAEGVVGAYVNPMGYVHQVGFQSLPSSSFALSREGDCCPVASLVFLRTASGGTNVNEDPKEYETELERTEPGKVSLALSWVDVIDQGRRYVGARRNVSRANLFHVP